MSLFGPPPRGDGVTRIVSGGQTGADRGGIDAAISLGIEWTGWAPKDWRAEDGEIPPKYRANLRQTVEREYHERTIRNVVLADATVVFTWGPPGKGSSLTIASALRFSKPHLHRNLEPYVEGRPDDVAHVLREFVAKVGVRSLNVAGSRESRLRGVDVLCWFQKCVAEIVTRALKS